MKQRSVHRCKSANSTEGVHVFTKACKKHTSYLSTAAEHRHTTKSVAGYEHWQSDAQREGEEMVSAPDLDVTYVVGGLFGMFLSQKTSLVCVF